MRTPRSPSRLTLRHSWPRSSSSSPGVAPRDRSIASSSALSRYPKALADSEHAVVCQTLTIVIPTYNERANLRSIVTGLLDLLPEAYVVVVDDSSPDGTGELADELAVETGKVNVL